MRTATKNSIINYGFALILVIFLVGIVLVTQSHAYDEGMTPDARQLEIDRLMRKNEMLEQTIKKQGRRVRPFGLAFQSQSNPMNCNDRPIITARLDKDNFKMIGFGWEKTEAGVIVVVEEVYVNVKHRKIVTIRTTTNQETCIVNMTNNFTWNGDLPAFLKEQS